MVRAATVDDIPFIVELAREYHPKSPWRMLGFDAIDLTDTLNELLATDGVIFVHKHGVICARPVPLYFSRKHQLLCKLFWIARKNGVALLVALEEWARNNGIAAIIAGYINEMEGDTVCHLLERREYIKLEQQLIKVL
jgi:hypothetical protein